MRLIRNILRPANISLSRPLRWRQVLKTSNESLDAVTLMSARGVSNISLSRPLRWRQVLKTLNESLNAVIFRTDHGSNIQLHGRSFSASAPSDAPQERKAGRRVPKHERKTMVENYVNKYREKKDGRFPTASEIQKDVGGSFYVVREILEELKYDFRVSSSDKVFTTSVQKNVICTVERSAMDGKVSPSGGMGEVVNHAEIKLNTQQTVYEGSHNDFLKNNEVVVRKKLEKKSLAEAEGALSAHKVVDAPIIKQGTFISISKSLKSEAGPQSSTSVAENDEARLPVNGKSKYVRSPSRHLTGEVECSLHSDPETNTKVETLSENKKNLDKRQQSTYSEISQRELDKVPTECTPEKKSTVWENLKSFASGVFGIWRR